MKTYLEKTKAYEIMGGAIVSGSFQRFEQGYLKDVLRYLGQNFYRVALWQRKSPHKLFSQIHALA